jgi:large subunit ribosomal protein L25
LKSFIKVGEKVADDISLKLEERSVLGKQVRQLRRDGFVPAVIHDHGKPSIHVMGKLPDVYKVYRLAGRHHAIKLSVGGKTYTALIKTTAFEPRKHVLSHVVFGAVEANETVTAEIPIRLSDDIPAEKASLLVIRHLESVEVEALSKDLPDEIVVDASSLVEVGDKLSVSDIIVPSGVVIITEPEHAIATVYEPSAVQAANDALAGEAEDVMPESEEGAETESAAGEAAATEGGAESSDSSTDKK